MTFKPKPILHFEDVMEDNGWTFILVKACGFYNLGFHCIDVVVASCKHILHPFYIGVILKDSNKCCV
jgi:hypothetical protein